jgi:predicted ester cyclase
MAETTDHDLRALHRALVSAVFFADDPRAIEPLMAASHVLHQSMMDSLPPGRGGVVWAVEQLRASFGKAYVQIEDQVQSEDRCFTRVAAQIRHTGRLLAARPTGRWVRVGAMVITRFAGGKAHETWLTANDLDVLRQLDAIQVKASARTAPPAPEAPAKKEA